MYQDIQVYVIPRIGDVIMGGAKKVHMFHLQMLRIDRYRPIPEYTIAKRAFDILFSGIANCYCIAFYAGNRNRD